MKHFTRLLAIAIAASGCATAGDDTSMSEAALSNNEATAFNYFVSKGLTQEQAAGIVGNLMQESSVVPTATESGGGPGRGIAQWSVGGRWDSSSHDNVTWYAAQQGTSRWKLSAQLDFIWFELTSGGYGYTSLTSATTVSDATIAFQNDYELCGACDSTRRIQFAEQAFAKYGGGGGTAGAGSGSGSGSGSGTSPGAGCYSGTLGREVDDNTCVQSVFDDAWYQCANGSWVDRWTDPDPCSAVYPL